VRIDELTGIKKFYNSDMHKVIRSITGPGAKFANSGEGALAKVFSHQSGIIYKFWVYDPAYEAYIAYCLENQQNRHVPILYSPIKTLQSFFKRPLYFPDVIKYVKMEKLDSCPSNKQFPGISQLAGSNVYPPSIENVIELIVDGNNTRIKNHINNWTFTPEGREQLIGFYNTIQDLFKIPGIRRNFDLHMGNVMLRDRKTIVITDPAATPGAIDFNDQLSDALWGIRNQRGNNAVVSGPSHAKTITITPPPKKLAKATILNQGKQTSP